VHQYYLLPIPHHYHSYLLPLPTCCLLQLALITITLSLSCQKYFHRSPHHDCTTMYCIPRHCVGGQFLILGVRGNVFHIYRRQDLALYLCKLLSSICHTTTLSMPYDYYIVIAPAAYANQHPYHTAEHYYCLHSHPVSNPNITFCDQKVISFKLSSSDAL
jgi:hypothetical protein